MLTTIRLHSFVGTNDGSVSCDFRGDKFIGSREGDEHHTLVEVDMDDSDPRVAEVLEFGPNVNKIIGTLEGKAVAGIHTHDKIPRLRIGVWDKKAPY